MTDEQLAQSIRDLCGTDDNDLAQIRAMYDRKLFEDNETTHGVYVQINIDDYVTAIDSDAFIPDLSYWIKVDEGKGELYKYARVNYCPKGLQTNGGYNYKLVDGVVVYAPQVEQPEDHNELGPQEQFFEATRNYEVGELITIQGRLYEVIAPIPDGGSITVGQNVVETTLSDYINSRTEA